MPPDFPRRMTEAIRETALLLLTQDLAEDLNETLGKIESAGGRTIMPKTLIAPGKGYWALFLDTEGNGCD